MKKSSPVVRAPGVGEGDGEVAEADGGGEAELGVVEGDDGGEGLGAGPADGLAAGFVEVEAAVAGLEAAGGEAQGPWYSVRAAWKRPFSLVFVV
ncbi:MAG: hypothetical protein R3F60_10120 [bacterium]